MPHTAYTVYEHVGGPYCGPDEHDNDPYVMYSPNTNGKVQPYCVRGDACREEGQGYWNYDGPAGGPP